MFLFMGIVRAARFILICLIGSLFIILSLEGMARICREYYGTEIHQKFFVNEDVDMWRVYANNETGAMGLLRTAHDQTNVAVVGGSATFNNGSNYSWPAFVANALPNAHLDNFSVAGPTLGSQLKTLQILEDQKLKYDLLFIEPPFMKELWIGRFNQIYNPWLSWPVFIGHWPLFFPSLLQNQMQRLLYLDPYISRMDWLPKREFIIEEDRYKNYIQAYGAIRYRDMPDYFSAEDEEDYVRQVDLIFTQAKRVAQHVLVVAPIMHYHGAADGSDRERFFKMLPTGPGEDFVSLKTLAEMTWKKNRRLCELAKKQGFSYYDGNPEFSYSTNRQLFFDQYHLYSDAQPLVAERLLKILEQDSKIEIKKRIHL